MPDSSCPHYRFHAYDQLHSPLGDDDCALTAIPRIDEFGCEQGLSYSMCLSQDHSLCQQYLNAARVETPVDSFLAGGSLDQLVLDLEGK